MLPAAGQDRVGVATFAATEIGTITFMYFGELG